MEKLYQKIVPEAKKPITDKEQLANLISNLESDNPSDKNNAPITQMGLDINVRKDTEIKKIKKKTSNWVQVAHINPYWKSFSAVAMLISAISASSIFIFLLVTNYATLPDQIPVLYNQSIQAWSYITRDQTLIIPIVHLVLTIIFLRLNLIIFKFDRRLVLTLNNSLILFNILYIFEIYQIFTMLQIY